MPRAPQKYAGRTPYEDVVEEVRAFDQKKDFLNPSTFPASGLIPVLALGNPSITTSP